MFSPPRFTRPLLFGTVLLAACPATLDRTGPGEVPDGGLPESGMADGGVPDVGLPESGMPDGRIPDLLGPDLRRVDARMTDLRMSGGALPDLRTSDGAMPDGAMGSLPSDAWLPDGVYVSGPQAGHVLISQNSGVLLGHTFTDWRVDVWLNQPPGVAVSQSMLGGCRVLTPGVGPGRLLDAGNLMLSGTPYGTKVIARDPMTQIYDVVVAEGDTTDGTLFTETSVLGLSVAGGADLHAITPQGPWHGVTPLHFLAPLTLDTLPAADLSLSWVAAPRADTTMEVSLRSQTVRIDCPVPVDSGSYIVKKQIIDALPSGPIYLLVHRLSTAVASTTPDHGPVTLESRSRWKIITRK